MIFCTFGIVVQTMHEMGSPSSATTAAHLAGLKKGRLPGSRRLVGRPEPLAWGSTHGIVEYKVDHCAPCSDPVTECIFSPCFTGERADIAAVTRLAEP